MSELPAEVRSVPTPSVTAGRRPAANNPRCEDCFFFQNILCALQGKQPRPTFRPAHPHGLRPTQPLSCAFRQEPRTEPYAGRPAAAARCPEYLSRLRRLACRCDGLRPPLVVPTWLSVTNRTDTRNRLAG